MYIFLYGEHRQISSPYFLKYVPHIFAIKNKFIIDTVNKQNSLKCQQKRKRVNL